MKINFGKDIKGEDDLRQFLEEFQSNSVQAFKYNLFGIEKNLVDGLEATLGTSEVCRTKNNALWVSQPQPFFFSLTARLPEQHSNLNVMYVRNFPNRKEVGTREEVFKVPGILWGYTEHKHKVSIYREIPEVSVKGSVVFERLAGVDPKPVLDILSGAGYSSTVVPTSQEVIAAFERARQSRHNRQHSDSQTVYQNSGDDLLAFGAGLLIGGALD